MKNFNLRDWGASLWENWGRPQRTLFVLFAILVSSLLPFAGISILDTPNASYSAVLVHPIAMFVLMALGLNIVVGKSGMLDLGYVAFFAIGAYAMGILGVRYSWNTWEVMPVGIILAMFAGLLQIGRAHV